MQTKKGLSQTTAENYSAMLRGFLKWNGINLRYLKNFKSSNDKLNHEIPFEILKKLSFRVMEYVRDIDLKLLLKICQISGLSSNLILNLKFGDLRNKDYNQNYIKIKNSTFILFIYGEAKELLNKYLESNKINSDSEYLFGDPARSYQNFQRRYKTAYNFCIKNEFPEFLKEKKAAFTIHSYKKIIETICNSKGISKKIDSLETFKLIQKELFKKDENNTIKEIKKDIAQEFLNSLFDKGRRIAIFNNLKNIEEKTIIGELNGYSFDIIVQKLIQTIKQEILEDPGIIEFRKNFDNHINKHAVNPFLHINESFF